MKKLIFSLILLLFAVLVYAENCQEGETKRCGPVDADNHLTSAGQCTIGLQRCVSGEWGICLGAVYPSEEVCGDKIDNDCDEKKDEGCECSAGEVRNCGESEVGACSSGVEKCVDNEWSGICEGAVYPAEETCSDNLDNDCDSFVDEDCGNVSLSSCFNNVKDGDELGVDCGGSCPIKCINCGQGEIKKSCYCAGVIYDSGYCCNNSYQQEACEGLSYLERNGLDNYTIPVAKEQVSTQGYIPWYVYLIVLMLLLSAIWFYVRKVRNPKKIVEISIHEKPSFKIKIEEKKAKARPSKTEKELEKALGK